MKSYSPYSHRDETCFVQGESGMYYPGVRVENVSFPLSISAVQAAVTSCLANSDQPTTVYQSKPKSELLFQWVDEFKLDTSEFISDPKPIYNPLLEKDVNVKVKLIDLTSSAVTIHSGFPVSCLLEVSDGFIPGVNVEVESWSLGLCAERVAIVRALAAGYTEFNSIHIYAPSSDFVSPCGACRQVLAEFLNDKTAELYHGDGTLSKHLISHLLPHGFTSASLKNR